MGCDDERRDKCEEFDPDRDRDRDCDGHDRRSACALKRIIDLLDCLNQRDLRVLDAVLDRIIRCRC